MSVNLPNEWRATRIDVEKKSSTVRLSAAIKMAYPIILQYWVRKTTRTLLKDVSFLKRFLLLVDLQRQLLRSYKFRLVLEQRIFSKINETKMKSVVVLWIAKGPCTDQFLIWSLVHLGFSRYLPV